MTHIFMCIINHATRIICVYDAPWLPPFSHVHIYAIAIGVCGVLQVQQETINRLPQHTPVHA